jgi:hypothetical protein
MLRRGRVNANDDRAQPTLSVRKRTGPGAHVVRLIAVLQRHRLQICAASRPWLISFTSDGPIEEMTTRALISSGLGRVRGETVHASRALSVDRVPPP